MIRHADRPQVRPSPWACGVAGLFVLGLAAVAPGSAVAQLPLRGRGQTLMGGTPTPELSSSSAAQNRAIAALSAGGHAYCTAWLASPRHAVTAAHCFAEDADLSLLDLELQLADGARAVLPIVAVDTHPTLDVAVALLGAAPDPAFAVEPLAFNAEALSPAVEGRRVVVAGAGLGTAAEQGVSFGVFTVVALEPTRLQLDGDATHGLCRGDSGGPYLLSFAEPPQLRVIAVESTGAPDCAGPAWGVRTDRVASWLTAVLARPATEPSPPCTAEAGRCEDGRQWRCRDGWWRSRDCAAEGAGCGELGPGRDPGCLPPACGAIDAHGVCVGGLARWCGDGRLEELDCAARGLGCGPDASAGGLRCLACTACGGQCVDLARDPRHCGACDVGCAVAHGQAACIAGRCALAGCDAGFVPQDGACRPLAADADQQVAPQTGGCTLAGGEIPLVSPGLGWLAAFALRRRKNYAIRPVITPVRSAAGLGATPRTSGSQP